MSEQSTITLSGLPGDGSTITATDGQAQAINIIVDEFNKQIPASKISADNAWTTWSTTYSGFSADPTQTLRYIKEGRRMTLEAGVPSVNGTSNATTYTMTMPYAAAADLRWPIWAIDNTGTTVVGRAETSAGSTTLTLTASIGGANWTNSGSKGASFTLVIETTV